MGEIAMSSLQFMKLCRSWGFEESRLTGHRQWQHREKSGTVSIRDADKDVNHTAAEQAAAILGITMKAFLAGPKTRKQLATGPRKKLVAALHRSGGKIEDAQSGRCTSILIEKVGGYKTNAGMSALLHDMEADGQVGMTKGTKRTYAVWLIYDGPYVADMLSAVKAAEELSRVEKEVSGGGDATGATGATGATEVGSSPESPAPGPAPSGTVPTPSSDTTAGQEESSPSPDTIPTIPYSVDDVARALFDMAVRAIQEGPLRADRLSGELEDLQQRLSKQVEYSQAQRARLARLEEEMHDAKRTIERLTKEKLQGGGTMKGDLQAAVVKEMRGNGKKDRVKR